VTGIHWFQWTDQMATGRHDGENYNTGLIDITDRPYKHLIDAIKLTNERLFGIRAGTVQPVSRRAKVQ
jgi:hypothetical protein